MMDGDAAVHGEATSLGGWPGDRGAAMAAYQRRRAAAARQKRRDAGLVAYKVAGLPQPTLDAIRRRRVEGGHPNQGAAVQEFVAAARVMIGDGYGGLPLLMALVNKPAPRRGAPVPVVDHLVHVPQADAAWLDGLVGDDRFRNRAMALSAIVRVCKLPARRGAGRVAA